MWLLVGQDRLKKLIRKWIQVKSYLNEYSTWMWFSSFNGKGFIKEYFKIISFYGSRVSVTGLYQTQQTRNKTSNKKFTFDDQDERINQLFDGSLTVFLKYKKL